MSDVEVDLPPSVGSSESEDVSLPPDVDDALAEAGPEEPGLTHGACSCKLRCHMVMAADTVMASRLAQMQLPEVDRRQRMWDLVKSHMVDQNGDVDLGCIKWQLNGTRICRPFWEHCHAAGHAAVDMIKKSIADGQLSLPVPFPRAARASRMSPQACKADAWFLCMYNDLAEPMAPEDAANEHQGVEPDHPLWNLCQALGNPKDRTTQKRYLNPGCFEDLWAQYSMASGAQGVSKSTLHTAWNLRWKRYMPFRNIGQGKRCRICARLDEDRRQASTEEDKALAVAAKTTHIDEVQQDRAVNVRGNKIAEQAAASPTIDGFNQILKITIDGMDQAKFRCPRNLASSAEFSSLWRPQLHVVGSIAWGHIEAYFIMNGDQAKDANMNCTVISRMLDIIADKMSTSGHGLPRSLIVSADNTTREATNQHFATFLASLTARNKFEATECQYLQTGHTHNELDQRFSSVASLLCRAPVLEDPEDFAEWIRSTLKPMGNRQLHVEVLKSTGDFQKWFVPLELQLSGLAATHDEPDTCHVWRFVRRSVLTQAGIQDIQCQHEQWSELMPADSDAVLLLKPFMHSKVTCQLPLLVMPASVAGQLEKDSLISMPLNDLGDRTRKEFVKTAQAVSKPPWNLFKAQSYLEGLCLQNQMGRVQEPPSFRFIFDYDLKETEQTGGLASVSLDEVRQVRSIEAVAPGPAEKRRRLHLRKRPAAAVVPEAGPAQEQVEEADGGAAAAEAAAPAAAAEELGEEDLEAGAPASAAAEEAADPAVEEEAAKEEAGDEDAGGGGVMRRPAAAGGVMGQPAAAPTYGCSKCRHSQSGCKQCRAWAVAAGRGFHLGANGEVIQV